MKKILSMGLVLASTTAFSKSYFVKLNSYKSMDMLQSKSVSADIVGARPVETTHGAYAVIESPLDEVAVQKLMANKSLGISYIEPNEIDYRPIDYTPGDSQYSSQWGLSNKYGVAAETAWNSQQGTKDFIVAVVDTGIDYRHPDLKANMWKNEAEVNGEEGVDDDGNGVIDDIHGYNAFADNGAPLDGHSHGTHCAGVIGAVHNNEGIAGVMANANLMAVKIFSDQGKTSVEAIVKGINYAIANGAKIMSNSWGGSQRSEGIYEAIVAAGEADILFVAAAGNGNAWGRGFDIDKKKVYPAGYDLDHVLSVGAIASNGKRSRFSNYGKVSVDIMAPGSDILSTVTNGGYKKMSGTSMATPHASGVAGLVLSEYPNASAVEIKRRIIDGVKKMSEFSNKTVSGGILKAPGALGL